MLKYEKSKLYKLIWIQISQQWHNSRNTWAELKDGVKGKGDHDANVNTNGKENKKVYCDFKYKDCNEYDFFNFFLDFIS